MTHLNTTRNPQSEARRQHIHGRLQRPADEPSVAIGALMLTSIFVIYSVLFFVVL